MSPTAFSIVFVIFLLASLCVRVWLALRHMRHVQVNRHAVPEQFAEKVPLAAHQKAADYTIAKVRLSLFMQGINLIVLLGFTFLGGLQLLYTSLFALLENGMALQLALLIAFAAISSVIDLPLAYYRQFVLEESFGFNRMTPQLFFMDQLKGTLLGACIGLPLSWVVLSLMGQAGEWWWAYAWAFLCAFQFLMLVLYPTAIAPMFNKFTPLEDEDLRKRIEGLMQRTGFASKGLFVMDGSKRSAHGNAYFSGFGAAKRIVFFDTLLATLSPPEVEAVLAHELGHFKLKHIVKRMVLSCGLSLGLLALLGYLKTQPWFYAGLGVHDAAAMTSDAMALLLFMLTLPVFTFFLSPVMAYSSRKHEYEADAFAVEYSNASDMVSALVKMYEDNAATLTPDPLHSAFYDSHPPASLRVGKLLSAQ